MPPLSVKITREGNLIVLESLGASATFRPRNKSKTYDEIIDACCMREKTFVTGSEELRQLEIDVDEQLTKIYLDYQNEGDNAKAYHAAAAGEVITDHEGFWQTAPDVPANLTFEGWQAQLARHYDSLKSTTLARFPPAAWSGLEFSLSITKILNIKDITLPFAGIVLGKPSGWKTFAIELLRGTPNTFYTDSFTAKSFVSHNSSVTKEELPDIDLLPKIKNKIFLTPELAPTFSAKEEDLTNIFGVITRLMDGMGYESDSGAQGHRGYPGEFMFVWAGAVVEIPRRVHKLLSSLGPKLYFYRLETPEKKEDHYLAQLQNDNFKQDRDEVYQALVEYLKWFRCCPTAEQVDALQKIGWGTDDTESLRLIVRFAKLLAHLRGSVPTWESKDTQGADYAYSVAIIEDPSRAATQLRNLARGHALSHGRDHITKDDLAIIAKVALSTAPLERVIVFNLLLAHKGTLTTSDIIDGINTSYPTAKRTMAECKALGLVDMPTPDKSNTEWRITLKQEFRWFLSEEFRNIGEEDEPTDNGENNARGGEILSTPLLKEKYPPRRHILISNRSPISGTITRHFTNRARTACGTAHYTHRSRPYTLTYWYMSASCETRT